jgi:hypothetical protein
MLFAKLSRPQPKLGPCYDLPLQLLHKSNNLICLYLKTGEIPRFLPSLQEYTINYFRMTNRSSFNQFSSRNQRFPDEHYPNVADPLRGKTRQRATDVGARRLGQDEQSLTVREILSEASRVADGTLSRE